VALGHHGVAGYPHFGQMGGWWPVWGGGWFGHPLTKKKSKSVYHPQGPNPPNFVFPVLPLGCPNHPQGPNSPNFVFPVLPSRWPNRPHRPPKGKTDLASFFFFFFLCLGGGQTTPCHPRPASHPVGQNGGGQHFFN
jgi:hypothetical protein